MTNREKWASKITLTDELVEDLICKTYAAYSFGGSKQDCPECPIKHLCDPYTDSDNAFNTFITTEEYMASVSDWLDEEAENDGSV